jgi:hypothetical protein
MTLKKGSEMGRIPWSSSKSAMVRLLGSTRTWARTVNGTLIQGLSLVRQFGLGASGPVGKLVKTLTFGLPFPVILTIAEAADQNGRQLSRSWSKPGCLRLVYTIFESTNTTIQSLIKGSSPCAFFPGAANGAAAQHGKAAVLACSGVGECPPTRTI